MSHLRSMLRRAMAMAAVLIILFPPYVEIDDSDSARTSYHFLFTHPVDWSVFVWPVTVFLMGLECIGVLLVAGIVWEVAIIRDRRKP